MRVALEPDGDGVPLARPVAGGSGDIVSFVRADGLVRIAAELDGAHRRQRVVVDLL